MMVAEKRSYHVLKKPFDKTKKLPKRVVLVATEIRCTEETKGGLRYDVIIADAASETPPKRSCSPKNVSGDEIFEKLKAAEKRRLSFETSKRNSLNSRFEKFEESMKKKEEEELEKSKLQKEKMDKKLVEHIEKREAYLNDIKSKLKDHLVAVENTRNALEKQEESLRIQLEEKLRNAAKKKEEDISRKLHRLKMHDERGKALRKSIESKKQEFMNQIDEKLTSKKEDEKVKEVLQKKCKSPVENKKPIA